MSKHSVGYMLSTILVAIIFSASAAAGSESEKVEVDVKGGGLKVTQGDNGFEIGGALMWDVDRFEGLHNHLDPDNGDWTNQSELRRARINLEGHIGDEWHAKVQLDFSDSLGTVDVDDALVVYSGWDVADINIGQTKEPFGLENLTSSKYTTFIERSMVSGAFSPGRQPGIGLSGRIKKRLTWTIGAFEATSSETGSDTYAVTGRITYVPWRRDAGIIHLGIAGSSRDMGGTIYRIDETAEVHTAREFVDSAEIQADSLALLGFELAVGLGPFSLQAEYMRADVDAAVGADADYDGYYIQASYFVTGDRRPYKKGVFGKVKPQGKSGALELAARYSYLDARDNQVGVAAANTVLGVTYYFNRQIRVMGNYIATRLSEDEGTEEEGTGNAISLRLQFLF